MLFWSQFALMAAALVVQTGCLVAQPRGQGQLSEMTEPKSKRNYWLYLPESYQRTDPLARKQRRWPLVVTFHGMKPFDHAPWQAHEWEAEADRFGYIVVAPVLNAPDVLAEFPLRRLHPAMRQDEEATLAILDHVFATTEADRGNVLSTGFSSGGYMAHYMLNRHPDRFTCLAARQANFCSTVLDTSLSPRSQHTPILVMFTENDLAICKEESQEAVEWYERYGYNNIGWVKLKHLGHVRTPDLAADFFGRAAHVSPLRPPTILAHRQALAGNAKGMQFLKASPGQALAAALASGASSAAPATPVPTAPSAAVALPAPLPPSSSTTTAPPTVRAPNRRSDPVAGQRVASPRYFDDRPIGNRGEAADPDRDPAGRSKRSRPRIVGEWPLDDNTRPISASSDAQTSPPPPRPTQPRVAGAKSEDFRYEYTSAQPVSIRVSSAIGIEPLSLGYWADCPRDWHRTASFEWTLDGLPIGSGINGQKTISDPGDHNLALTVTTIDGKLYRTARRVRVLAPPPSSYYTQARR